MKSSLLVLILSLVLSHAALARELVISLSPHVSKSVAGEQATSVLQFLTGLEPGDMATLIDGYNLSTIGTFEVPDNSRYNNPRARLSFNQKAVAALLQFAESASVPTGNQASFPSGAIRLPQLLRHVALNVPHEDGVDVLVFGSPFYTDPDESHYNMTGGIVWPSDGCLLLSRGDSPFGTAGEGQLLANMRLHQVYGGESLWIGDRHKYLVERFWTLYVDQLGGAMATFTGDPTLAYSKISNNTPAPPMSYEMEESTKATMYTLRWEEASISIFERELATHAYRPDLTRGVEGIEIGLSWTCQSCDLDLYVKPYPDADALYFGNTETREGIYWKDFREQAVGSRGFETVELRVPVDLRNLAIAVNFYGGVSAGGVDGELRLSIDGSTWASTFHIDADSGNAGTGAQKALDAGRATTPHTVVMSPLAVLER